MKNIDKDFLLQLDAKIVEFLVKDRQFIFEKMGKHLEVDEKQNRRDLVTEVDRGNQAHIIEALSQLLPNAKILAEESENDLTDAKGLMWVIDPIDGTMNFVKQREDFAVMIALYEDGKPLLGYIYDVMRDVLLHGGPGIGVVYKNQDVINPPANLSLEESLIGLSGPMLVNNAYHFQDVEKRTLGARVIGSAGIEFIRVLLGKQIGYVSSLKPWDFAAGNALAAVFGLKVGYVDGEAINVLKSGVVLVATKKAYSAIMSIVK